MGLETLEDRLVLSTFTVNSLSDSASPPLGALTLRQAIADVNNDPGRDATHPDTIAFSVTGAIDLASNLPTLPSGTTIQGPGASSLTIAAPPVSGSVEFAVASSAQGVSISGLTLAGGSGTSGFQVGSGASATLSSTTIQGNLGGGAIDVARGASLTVSASTITGNASSTGAIAVGTNSSGGATLTILQSTVSNNVGSGIFLQDSPFAGPVNHLRVSQSTISGNSGPASTNPEGGGGIYDGASDFAMILDSTIAGNRTTQSGGGIALASYATLAVDGSTIAGNQAASTGSGGGLDIPSGAYAPTLTDTIVAGNTRGSGASAPEDDVSGALAPSGSFNLIGLGTGMTGLVFASNGNLIGQASAPLNPDLGPLASNGGPTQTMALLGGSPAIDRGGPDAGLDATLSTDQKGQARVDDLSADFNAPGGDGRDIGASEVEGSPAPTVLTVNSTADASPPAGVLTLREAIGAADGTIPLSTLPAGQVVAGSAYHFVIDLAVSGEIDLATNLPALLGSVEIDGPGASALTIKSQGSAEELQVGPGADASISGLTLSGPGSSTATTGLLVQSGAIASLASSVVSNNSSTSGAGITVADGASLSVVGSTISNNGASTGGGIRVGVSVQLGGASLTVSQSTISGNHGGGIYVLDSAGGVVPNAISVSRSTISGNTTVGDGGGLYLGVHASANVSDSTIANNRATSASPNSPASGGGIFASSAVTLNVARSTIAGNFAATGGGGIGAETAYTPVPDVLLSNTIVAGNTGGTASPAAEDDVAGALDPASRYNLIGLGSGMTGIAPGSNGNLVGTAASGPINPLLGPLSNNGGPTLTMALGSGSPALGAGSHEATTFPDQRGVARSTVANIGAYQATFSQIAVATTAPTTVAGASHLVIVEAVDSLGQIAFGQGGPLTLSSTDPLAVLPSGLALSSGMASFLTDLETAGSQTISATDGGITGSASGIVVTPAAASELVIETGQSQSAIVGSTFANPFQVLVEDPFGNPVPGLVVGFVARSTSPADGTFANGTNLARATSDAHGLATAPAFAANASTGSYTVQATSLTPALGPATFSLTNTAAGSLGIVAAPTFSALQYDPTGTIAVATFSDPDLGNFPVSGYSATISWGDGSRSAGVVSVVNGDLVVSGSHTFASPGTFPTVVLLTQAATGRSARATGQATVDADLAGQLTAARSGLHFSHATNLYSGTITLTNAGSSAISGSIAMVLAGLPSTVTLANASGTTGSGLPEIVVLLATPLAPGQSLAIPVQFADTSILPFDYGIRVYDLPQ